MRSKLIASAGAVAAAAIGVSAQYMADTPSVSVVYVTSYTDDCSTFTAPAYASTVTGTVVVSYCPSCIGIPSSTPVPTSEGIYTTYTTVFSSVCSTGLIPVTYTVTESCSSTGQTREASYVPQGFTTTTVTQSCECENPITTAITAPIPGYTPGPTPSSGPVPQTSGTLAGGVVSPGPSVSAPAGSPSGSSPGATNAPAAPANSSPASSPESYPALPATLGSTTSPQYEAPSGVPGSPAGASPASQPEGGASPAVSAETPGTLPSAPGAGAGSGGSPARIGGGSSGASGAGSLPGYGSIGSTTTAPIAAFTGGASSKSLCMSLAVMAMVIALYFN
ncbi:hypothetical protein MMC06_003109 [Schaereria dolodes]|nr:hypothetical protein [Schaereria dolodes]